MDAVQTTLTSAGLISLVVSGLVATLFKLFSDARLAKVKDQLKHDSDRSLELVKDDLKRESDLRLVEFKTQMDAALARSTTQFEWVYERQAKSAIDLYALLVKLEAACNEQLRILAYGGDSEKAREGEDRLTTALRAFQDFYQPASINFDDKILDKIKRIDQQFSGDAETFEPYDHRALVSAIEELKQALQDLLGGPLRRRN